LKGRFRPPPTPSAVETIYNIIETDAAQEGLNAFNEKRPPNW
jgi:1,4-dihydroxy-2-naphthoyl-CoA synthase